MQMSVYLTCLVLFVISLDESLGMRLGVMSYVCVYKMAFFLPGAGRSLPRRDYLSYFPCRYDPKTNRWSPVASMQSKRKHLGVAVLDGMIYAVGGRDESTELSSVER